MQAGNRANRPRRRDLSDHGVEHPAARRDRRQVTTGLGEVHRAVGCGHLAAGIVDLGTVGRPTVTGQTGDAGPSDDPKPSRRQPLEDLVATAIADVEASVVRDRQRNRLIRRHLARARHRPRPAGQSCEQNDRACRE
jgi:hypothetical protein